ncbi:MAG: hypothetical protein ACLGSD_02960 [Acidobacteriota bacterium]
MRTKSLCIVLLASLVAVCAIAVRSNAQSAYAKMAPLNRYLIADKNAEVALARSGAPPAVGRAAEVLVLGRDGYTTAVKGTNGFVCVVERSWAVETTDAQFWNPKIRAPLCFNAAAAKTFLPIYLMKTRMVLEGKSKQQIGAAIEAGFKTGRIPALAPGAMCYMLSKQQYLNDTGKSWHPHVMFYVSGAGADKSWGANLDGSPMIAADDAQEHTTVMMVWAPRWSDGTPGPPMQY